MNGLVFLGIVVALVGLAMIVRLAGDRMEAGSAIVSDDELAAADAARRVWEQTL